MARGANKEYEVERILRATVSYKSGRTIHWKYLVKWKGYSDKDNTWEPVESFEASPKLIGKFWKKVDTGGRNPKSARLFQRGEELSLPDNETWSDDDAEGEDDEEETEKKEGDESATPKAGRKKRSSTATETPAKRKRGRPSKAEKEATAAEEDKNSDVDGGVASRRNSRRLSQKRPDKHKNEGTLKRLLDASSSEDSSSEDKGPSKHTERKDFTGARKDAIQKPTLKKRKAYIESDEEDADAPHSDAEGSSHDGSLFSGDDEQEQDGEVAVPPVPEPPVEPEITPIPKAPKVKNWSEATVNKRYRRQPRVKMIDDPNIVKALEARVGSKIHGRPANAPGPSTKFGSILSPMEEDGSDGSDKPSLPPSKNDNLTTRPSPEALKTPLLDMHVPPDSRMRVHESPNDSVMDTTQDSTVTEGLPVDATFARHDEMDDSPDLAPSTDTSVTVLQRFETTETTETTEVVSVQAVQSGPPPTAEELLRLSGAQYGPDDLPDFQPDEEAQYADSSTGTGDSGVATTSVQDPAVSNTHQTTSDPAPGGAWKSILFNVPTPRSIIEKVLASSLSDPPPLPVVPSKLVLQLRLDPISRVPVILKDVVQPQAGHKLSDLLVGEYDGPPGKVFSLNVLQHVQAGGPAARVVSDDDCSDEQRLWFSKLLDELEKGSLFIIVTNGHSFALCSSSHHDATHGLGLPSSLVGLSRTIVMQFITITDSTSYASFAIAAEDLKVR